MRYLLFVVLFINGWIISFLASFGEPQSQWLMCMVVEKYCD